MADGVAFAKPAALYGNMSTMLSGAAIPEPPNFELGRPTSGYLQGTRGALVNPAVASPAKTGVTDPGHDAQWFERIHVIPRTKALGAILAEQNFQVEVWNAFRARSKPLNDIQVTGAIGLGVTNPLPLPTDFPPNESRLYTVTAETTGDPLIDNLVTFTFAGIATSGTTVRITGTRFVAWPFPWNPGAGELLELYGALTDIFEARDGSEQRRQLVGGAGTLGLEYSVLLSERDAAHASALLYGWQGQPYGVPHWQHATRLATQVTAGDETITVDTTSVPYEVGGQVILWRDPYTWEALTIESVSAGAIGVTTPAQFTWPVTVSVVMPISVGRVSEEEGIDWIDLALAGARLAFSLEKTPRPAAPTGFTQYEGFDVLDQRAFNRVGAIADAFRRRFAILDPGTGKRQSDVPTPAPAPMRPFRWECRSRAEAAALRSFLAARNGRAVPFWVPSYQHDLVLAQDAANGATSLTVRRVAYTQQMFPAGGARRHVALYPRGSSVLTLRKITGATDPGDGLTESLALAALPQAYPAATSVVSFLRLCRLEDDQVPIEWLANGAARAVIRMREIPNEAPT